MSLTPTVAREKHAALVARVAAFREAWRHKERAPTATLTRVLSAEHLGERLSERITTRLLEGRRELDNAIAQFGATLAGAIARLTRDADTSALERSIQEELLRHARTDETFENRLHEIAPLVDLYARLGEALGR